MNRNRSKPTTDLFPTREDTFAALVESIRRCAVLRGDTDSNRDALIAEACELTPAQHVDLLEHFTEQAAIWATATGAAP